MSSYLAQPDEGELARQIQYLLNEGFVPAIEYGRRLRGQDQEHPGRHRVLFQVLLRDQVLALPSGAEDHRDCVRGRPGLDPAGEPARHPH